MLYWVNHIIITLINIVIEFKPLRPLYQSGTWSNYHRNHHPHTALPHTHKTCQPSSLHTSSVQPSVNTVIVVVRQWNDSKSNVIKGVALPAGKSLGLQIFSASWQSGAAGTKRGQLLSTLRDTNNISF